MLLPDGNGYCAARRRSRHCSGVTRRRRVAVPDINEVTYRGSPRDATDRNGPVPILLGVIGHCAVSDANKPALASALARIFGELRVQHPHTPLALLSSLAEDVERLVARLALA